MNKRYLVIMTYRDGSKHVFPFDTLKVAREIFESTLDQIAIMKQCELHDREEEKNIDEWRK